MKAASSGKDIKTTFSRSQLLGAGLRGEVPRREEVAAAKRAAEERERRAEEIIVCSGSLELPEDYETLGPVEVKILGSQNARPIERTFNQKMWTPWPLLVYDQAHPEHQIVSTDLARIDKALKDVALSKYGIGVSAIINATYWQEPNGTVSAKGIAIRFVTDDKD